MWKMHTSNTVPNMAQDVLCRRNMKRDSSSMTYVVVRHVFAWGDKPVDIVVSK